ANLGAASAQYLESTRGEPPILEEGKERFLIVLPLFHIYALSAAMLLGIRLGAALVLHTKFDVDAVFKEIAGTKISVFPGVPTMYTGMLSHPKVGETDLRSLKFCGSGGAPLPVEVEQRFFDMTGCHLNEGWGMTETSPSGTFTPARGVRKAGSCGMPLPGIDIKLLALDGSGNEVATGEPGELSVKGLNVMKGYWNNEKATAESFTPDGYFKSGDVAKFDADGFLYIVDRTKDMLLCGGFNVYPRVLEEAIYEHPGVAEVCVIGVPDEYRGQSPKAFVVQKAGAEPITLDALKAFLKDRLGKHEMIGHLEVRSELPKTAVGKLSKKDLVEEEARKRATA
ncbi:MAG: long-chain fatty acid--CoA ligase, partial [Comamonadaceae bacterium]